MTTDDPRWRALPVLRELHDQWWAARGGRIGEARRPFSRDWNQLLEVAGLVSAEQRREAEGDARMLATCDLVALRPVRYRPNLIDRILIPLDAETRLAALFGDSPADGARNFDPTSVRWAPELNFVAAARLNVAPDDLLKLNAFLAQVGSTRCLVPVTERSLQIFGDEKRLDGLLSSALFRPDRLSLEMLGCERIGEPLGWKRGPREDGPLLIIENKGTWHSYCRWNQEAKQFSAVVYGKGFVVAESVRYLADIFDELGGPRRLCYFGDLDPPGLMIPQQAAALAQRRGLPAIEPHFWSYRHLLEIGRGKEARWEGDPADALALAWMGDLAQPIQALFASGKRLAQEHVGWDFLSGQEPPAI